MKILFDHQIWSSQRFGGVSRYFFELIQQLEKISGFSYEIALRHSNNEYLRKNPKVAKAVNTFTNKKSLLSRIREKLRLSNTAKKWYNFLKKHINQRTSVLALKKTDFDVFHPTYYDPYFLPYLKERPFVLTVYDMIHELYPGYFSAKEPTPARKKLLMEKATKIIAISGNTKNDIVKMLGVDPKKIEIIHLATTFGEITPEMIDAPKRFILYVGSRERYKNFATVARGAAPLLRSEKDLYLFCAGGGDFNASEKKLMAELSIENKVIRQNATDGELSYLYRHAECFVFASLYEGFGIPILESLACGCPTVLSRASCFPEIAGNAAAYFEPNDPASLTKTLQEVYGDRNYRAQLIRLGNEKSKEYSWEKAAQKTFAVYQSCLSKK